MCIRDRVYIFEVQAKMTTNPLRAEAPTLISGKRIEPERDFLARIAQECRRAERSGQRFVLVLLEGTERIQEWLPLIITPLAPATRETDAWGWYEEGYTLGILFSELGKTDPAEARRTIVEKIRVALHGSGAVSYTHLDVYKRQPRRSPSPVQEPAWPRPPSRSAH